MKVLVIGGTGFISTRLVDFLCNAGHDVTTLNRGKSGARPRHGVERLEADRHDEDRLRALLTGRKFNAVFDMVAYTPEESQTMLTILEGKTQRFIHCSTISVYMVSDEVQCPITEDQAQRPLMSHDPRNPFGMDYGVLKRRCEDVLWKAHSEERFQVSMLRPPFVCGARDPASRDFFWIERILDRRPLLVPGCGDFAFQVVFVDDVARTFVELLDSPATIGEAYNVAADEVLTLNEYLRLLGELLGESLDVVHVPQDVFDRQVFSSNPGGDVFPFNTRRTAVLSLEAVRNILGYRSTPFRSWMSETIEWYLHSFDGHSHGWDLRDAEVRFAAEWRKRERRLRTTS